jgi:hypothetical protein
MGNDPAAYAGGFVCLQGPVLEVGRGIGVDLRGHEGLEEVGALDS